MRGSSTSRPFVFVSLILMFALANIAVATDQANEIVCSSGTGCTAGFVAVFNTNGGSAQVNNSLLSQSGTTVTLSGNQHLTGNLSAAGKISGSAGSFSGNLSLGGNLSMAISSATAGNFFKGGSLFLHNFGSNNTFVGQNAGNLTLATGTANNNTGVGTNALAAISTGCCNTANGNNALLHNTSGGGNSAMGDGALYTNTTGGNNTAIGRWALISNSTGNSNTAVGVTALRMNTGGASNSALGYQALQNNCPSTCNPGFGEGDENTAIGYQALSSNDFGSYNVAIGAYALQNTVGATDSNTAVGHRALLTNTSGGGNTAIGIAADVASGNLSNATAIGNGAVVNASNKIRLGNTLVTVVEGPPYSTVSDRNKKENFKAIDAEEVLRKVRDLKVMTWNYIGQDPYIRHYGPVAQDFFAAFGNDGLGTIGSDTTITSTDLDGVLLLAVQALEKRIADLATLKAENADLKARLEKLERVSGYALKDAALVTVR